MIKSVFRLFKTMVILSLGLNAVTTVQAQDIENPTYLYKTTLMRAAPGQLLELINILKQMKADGYYKKLGQDAPYIMRHSQGDQWDLLLLQPMESYQVHFSAKRSALNEKHQNAVIKWKKAINANVIFKSDLFAYGPNVSLVGPAFADNDFYHVEMFSSLAGQHAPLIHERAMENDYLVRTKRKANMIFVGDAGNDFDNFTIGFHKSMQAFAVPNPTTPEETEAAIVASGFPAGTDIGAYLRQFLNSHHDTLANAVR